VNDIGLRAEPGQAPGLPDQVVVEVQRGPHMQIIMHIRCIRSRTRYAKAAVNRERPEPMHVGAPARARGTFHLGELALVGRADSQERRIEDDGMSRDAEVLTEKFAVEMVHATRTPRHRCRQRPPLGSRGGG
jgi:hypothetical protein